MARYDDLNTKMIAYWAVLSIVILIITLQGTQALCYNMMNSLETDRWGSELMTPAKAKSEQLTSLEGYRAERVIDEAAPPPKKGEKPATKEVLYIPISEAQKLIVKELASPKTGT